MTDSSASPPSAPAPGAAPSGGKRGPLRWLYDWVLGWAYTPYALPALIVLSFAESSFFPVPPDVLLLPLCLGARSKAFRYAFWCSVASVAGGIAGYWLGATLWDAGLREICFDYIPGFKPDTFDKIKLLYEDWNFWIIFAAGFSPLPYKVFTVTAGVFGIAFVPFLIASVVGRSSRFFLEAWLLQRYGEPIRDFVEKRLALMSLLFCVVLVGGFAAIKLLLH